MHLVIVIPCFNEASRFSYNKYQHFFKHEHSAHAHLVFVNDGSTDQTQQKLLHLQTEFPKQIDIVNLRTNLGKANAVRAGVLYALSYINEVDKIAFLDADLATSLEECVGISEKIQQETTFVFGSRIKKIDNEISRKLYRHLLGRVIATFISSSLKMSVYDTQCGCKVFDKAIAELVFKDAFTSKWLFDVEIFFRLKRNFSMEHIKKSTQEIPLKKWIDKSGSKVSLLYSFRVGYDLYKIKKQYAK